VLAALSGVVKKEELLELMISMGLTKQFDSKDKEVINKFLCTVF
jgi:hypothetical protein